MKDAKKKLSRVPVARGMKNNSINYLRIYLSVILILIFFYWVSDKNELEAAQHFLEQAALTNIVNIYIFILIFLLLTLIIWYLFIKCFFLAWVRTKTQWSTGYSGCQYRSTYGCWSSTKKPAHIQRSNFKSTIPTKVARYSCWDTRIY